MAAPKNNKFARAKRSARAKRLGKNLADQASKGMIPEMYDFILKHGYSKWIARTPQRVLSTQSVREEIDPILHPMEEIRALGVGALMKKIKGGALISPRVAVGELSDLIKTSTEVLGKLSGKDGDNEATVKFLMAIGEAVHELRGSAK